MFAHLSKTQFGMILALGGYTCFAFSDTCVKILSEKGYSIYQIIALDTAAGCLMLLALSSKLGGIKSLKDPQNTKIHVLRSLLNIAINLLVVYCLSIMPIATVYTAVFTKPFIALLIAMPLYGERIGLHRIATIILGMIGILLAFQPWNANSAVSLADMGLLLITTSVIAGMFVIARSLKDCSLLAIAFYPIAASCVATAPLMMLDFSPIEPGDVIYFLLSGLFMTTGILTISVAFKIADSAAVSPMLYVEMFWALLFGYLIFGDAPGIMMLIGVAIIIASGIYLIIREHKSDKALL